MPYITIDNLTSIMAEMSDYCNAACPMCNRYDWNLNLIKEITNTHHTTLDFVKQRIGEEVISKLEGWVCQGTYGDALMNPETIDIFKYLNCFIVFSNAFSIVFICFFVNLFLH